MSSSRRPPRPGPARKAAHRRGSSLASGGSRRSAADPPAGLGYRSRGPGRGRRTYREIRGRTLPTSGVASVPGATHVLGGQLAIPPQDERLTAGRDAAALNCSDCGLKSSRRLMIRSRNRSQPRRPRPASARRRAAPATGPELAERTLRRPGLASGSPDRVQVLGAQPGLVGEVGRVACGLPRASRCWNRQAARK